MVRNAGLVGDVGSKANICPRQNRRTYLEEEDIQETARFLSAKYHWVVGLKAKVHVLVQAVAGVKVPTELVAAGRRYCDVGFLEFCQGTQAAEFADQGEVLAVREMEEARDSVKRIGCVHGSWAFRMALANGALCGQCRSESVMLDCQWIAAPLGVGPGSCTACGTVLRCQRFAWRPEVLLETRCRQAHGRRHMTESIALGHPGVGVAEDVLDEPGIPCNAIQGGP